MAIIGYIRVSSEKQTVSHQKHEIQKFAKNNNIDNTTLQKHSFERELL